MKKSELRQLIREEISKVLNEVNQPYEVISKKIYQGEFGDKEYYDIYTLKLNEEDYTTPEGLTFKIITKGRVMVPEGETLDFNKSTHYFHYIQTMILDENGNEIEKIPGMKVYGTYEVKASINKAKKWLNTRGSKFLSGVGYQHKST
jgi:hypothetical protein